MGKLTGGIDYDMIGRTGNHVGRRVKGENIISMRPAKSNRPPSPLQYDQRLKFGLFTRWLRKALQVLEIGYQHHEKDMSAYNMAVSENLAHAVTGVSPNFSINYAMARFSKGLLQGLAGIQAVAAEGAVIEYTWDNLVGQNYSKGTDQVALVVYNKDLDEFVTLTNVAARSLEGYDLQLPLDWTGNMVHSYVFTVGADGKRVSNSTYIGQNTVM